MHCLIRIVRSVACFAVAAGLASGAASGQTKLLRFPDIHRDKVVFTYAGDLWTAPSSGGTATRLTAHPGLELFAKFSPDGKWIAFTGQYDGDEQVYVIPATGGVPKQLTFYPARGPFPPRWGTTTRSTAGRRTASPSSSARCAMAGITARAASTPCPSPAASASRCHALSGGADLSPDGKQVVYTPFARDFRTWKRYQGGWAQDLWTFDLATHATKKITDTPRTERDPMWIGNKIYFDSDRTGTLNLYSYDLASGSTVQLTKSTQWDVRWPSADEEGQIVYEMNGELNVFDTRSGQSRHLAIDVPGDGLDTRPSQLAAGDQIEDAALSPKGERALFTARGDIFNTPIEKGVTRNLTRTSGAHDKGARWSPDGRKVAYLSDGTGEEEVYVVDALGVGKPEQITSGGKGQRFPPEWSADGKRLAFSDKDGRLWVVSLADKKLVEVAHDTRNQIRDYAWSACGGHLAFSLTNANTFRSIWIWSVEDGKPRQVTDEQFHSVNPAWDPKGEYLYYLSARSYQPQMDAFDLNFAEDRNFGIFALALRKDVANPFSPEEDTVTLAEEKKAGEEGTKHEAKDKKDNAKEPAFTRIDFDGLASRVARVPVPFDNYNSLSAAEGRLLFVRQPPNTLGGEPAFKPSLQVFTVKDRKAATLAESVDGYTLSQDGNKALISQDGHFNVYDATAAGKDSKKAIDTGGMVVDRVPAEEWAEVFREAWRRYRDYFYVSNMNGYDWEALRRQYEPLLAYAGHRSDVNYIIGEMIAELNNSHSYVAGGDSKAPARPRVALPGARFELDAKAGRYRIAKIFGGENEEDLYRSPLTEIGINVHVGDYVLAVDGEDLAGGDNPYRLLRHKADRPRPPDGELQAHPRRRPGGHLPADRHRGAPDLSRLGEPQPREGGEDERRADRLHPHPRHGRGRHAGVRQVVLRPDPQGRADRRRPQQRRRLHLADPARTPGAPSSGPRLRTQQRRSAALPAGGVLRPHGLPAQRGVRLGWRHLPYMFRQLGLGPLIGTRTWGGVVGINYHGPMIDGGQIFVPEFGSVSLEGKWVIEGHGVDPDIVVENDVQSVLDGRDPQLERGVAEVMKKIQTDPKAFPRRPEPPVRTQGQ